MDSPGIFMSAMDKVMTQLEPTSLRQINFKHCPVDGVTMNSGEVIDI